MSMVLNREALRVVQKNERNVVVYRKRYKRGDVVDTSRMLEDQVERLTASGALVESAEDLTEPGDAMATPPVAPPFGAATGGLGDGSLSAPVDDYPSYTDKPRPDEWSNFSDAEKRAYIYEETEGDGDEVTDSSEQHDVDEFDAMDYATLQSTAKSKDLNAGGSAEDLRARLRADAADQA